MPRFYKRRLGAALRRDYSPNKLEEALQDIVENNISLRQASQLYDVPRSTLHRKFHGENFRDLGKPPALSTIQENNIVKAITFAADGGFPFTPVAMRKFVQDYLNRKGLNIFFFVENMPGKDWFESFLRRNKQLSLRLSENTKRCRAALSRNLVNSYFDELEQSIRNIPAENIINYDETNLPDDPGREKVIAKKGSKHARRTIDSSKSSVSVMFAGTASGMLLPPYVVYKSKHLYPEWLQGGPDGCHYNRSTSGWFDSILFEVVIWFFKVVLPYVRRRNGSKLLIGDNLGSHICEAVIQACEENDIKFVFFLPNSTHRCQPLDLSFFRPLKISWRKRVTAYKLTHSGCIPKTIFPSLLRNTLNELSNVADIVKSGFRAAGISPLNRNEVLKHFPIELEEIDDALVTTFTHIVENLQTHVEPRIKRSKKINVPAGKSVSLNDLATTSHKIPEEHENEQEDSSDDEEEDRPINELNEPEDIIDDEEEDRQINELTEQDFVLARFIYDKGTKKEKTKIFVGQVIKISKQTITIRCMRSSSKNSFIFPDIEDICEIKNGDIGRILPRPSISRGRYTFEKLNLNF